MAEIFEFNNEDFVKASEYQQIHQELYRMKNTLKKGIQCPETDNPAQELLRICNEYQEAAYSFMELMLSDNVCEGVDPEEWWVDYGEALRALEALKAQKERHKGLLSDASELFEMIENCSYWDMDKFNANKEKVENIIKEISDEIGGGKDE